MQVTPEVMPMLGELMEREVTRDGNECTAAMASLTVSEKFASTSPARRKRKGLQDSSSATSTLDSSKRFDENIIQGKRTGGRVSEEEGHL